MLTGDSVPTHTQGGRLDYVALSSVLQCPIETHLLPTLLSDHFALESTFPWSYVPLTSRKRLTISTASVPQLVSCGKSWYTVTKATFSGVKSLYQGLLEVIKGFVSPSPRAPGVHTVIPTTSFYAKDLVIISCQKTLAAYQRRWQCDPTDYDARNAMASVARHLTDLRKEARQCYWGDILGQLHSTQSL